MSGAGPAATASCMRRRRGREGEEDGWVEVNKMVDELP
jgi:hypothetical protein